MSLNKNWNFLKITDNGIRFNLFCFSLLTSFSLMRLPLTFFLDIFLFWLVYFFKRAGSFFNLFIYSIWLNSFYLYCYIDFKPSNLFSIYLNFISLRSLSARYISNLNFINLNFINSINSILSFSFFKLSVSLLSWINKFNFMKLNLFFLFNSYWLGAVKWVKSFYNKNAADYFNKYYYTSYISIYRLFNLNRWRYFRQFNFLKKAKTHLYGLKKIRKKSFIVLLNYMLSWNKKNKKKFVIIKGHLYKSRISSKKIKKNYKFNYVKAVKTGNWRIKI